jgi:cytochrome c biogenesis protein CcmG/thiol:disulfide interchange protein DsbE
MSVTSDRGNHDPGVTRPLTASAIGSRPRWPHRLRIALVVLILMTVGVVLASSFRRDPHDIRTGSVGKPAATFDLDRLDGAGQLGLDDYRGRVVILNFWASWCVPCKEENPALAATWERYRATTDVVLIGVLYQDSVDAAREYTSRLGNTWPSVIDADGRTAIAYGVFGIPETFFISPDGVVAGRHVGPIDQPTLINGIEAIRQRH